jgi:hypothetical protein
MVKPLPAGCRLTVSPIYPHVAEATQSCFAFVGYLRREDIQLAQERKNY